METSNIAVDKAVDASPEPKKTPLLQWRPKDSKDIALRNAYYSPARDIAYCGPIIVERAMKALNEECWEPWLKEHLAHDGITVDTIIETEAPLKMARTLNKIISHSLQDALQESEFTLLPAGIQMLFYARIGQLLLAALFCGVKDVNAPEDDPPATIQSLLAETERQLSATMRQGVARD